MSIQEIMENPKTFLRLFTISDMLILMCQNPEEVPSTTNQQRKNIRRRFMTRMKQPFQMQRFKSYLEDKRKSSHTSHKKSSAAIPADVHFPINAMKRLLCKWVPSGAHLSIPGLQEENWLREEDETLIQVTFKERFSHIPHEDLEILRHDICYSPRGMVTIESVRRLVDNGIKCEIEQLDLSRKMWLKRQLTARKAELSDKLDSFGKVMPIIKEISHRLGRVAAAHAHEGSSTYAEPTMMGLLDIAKALRPLLGLPTGHVMMDAGCGVGTAIWTLCHALGTRGIGVEYSDNRMFCGSKAVEALLFSRKGDANLQHKVVLIHRDLFKLTRLRVGVTVSYQFDEAFTDVLMDHMLQLYANAPPSLRFIISSKAYKHPRFVGKFQSLGLYPLTTPILCVKTGSGESSAFIIYGRECCDYTDLGNKVLQPPPGLRKAPETQTIIRSRADSLDLFDALELDVEQMEGYYKNLSDTMEKIISAKRGA